MLRWLCTLVVAVVVSGFAFLLLTGRYLNRGQVLFRVSPEHGLHSGDLLVIAGWVVAMLALLTLARRGDRP